MNKFTQILALALAGGALQLGCRDNVPPPPYVPPPQMDRDTYRYDREPPKPLPSQGEHARLGPTPFHDEPLLVDTPPEARAFVDVYNRVGRPRILVFVNRTLEGQIIPSHQPAVPERVTERIRRSTAELKIESNEYERSADRRGEHIRDSRDRFESRGPAEYSETTSVYLRPGEYDEVAARSIDYQLIEALLSDWLSADNRVTIISSTMGSRRLTDEQVKDLQAGRPRALSEVARRLDADVLVQVQARPTRQVPGGLEVRMIAEAMNVAGGQSLARAAVDVMPPLDKVQSNKHTRFLARKLMDGMVQAWSAPMPPEKEAPGAAPPAPPGSPPSDQREREPATDQPR